MNNNWIQKVGVWLVVGLILFTVFKQFDKPRAQENITYSQFMDESILLSAQAISGWSVI